MLLLLRLCCGIVPIQRQYNTGGYHSGQNSGFSWTECICCISAWSSASYLGCGYRAKLVEYPINDLRLMKRCFQWTAASMTESLDLFSMRNLVVKRLKRAKIRVRVASRPTLGKAIISNDIPMPSLVDVVAKEWEWPLVISYLKETGRINDGGSLLVTS